MEQPFLKVKEIPKSPNMEKSFSNAFDQPAT